VVVVEAILSTVQPLCIVVVFALLGEILCVCFHGRCALAQVTLVVANILEAYDASGKPKLDAIRILPGSARDTLPDLGSADVVTCSYCLTMIPPWAMALEVMVSMVKKGGTLALIDFTKREDMPAHWTQVRRPASL
jgi:hypothetical protein